MDAYVGFGLSRQTPFLNVSLCGVLFFGLHVANVRQCVKIVFFFFSRTMHV